MNIPVLIVACIMALAVVAHVIGGTRETAALKPDPSDSKLTAHWVQALCAFQMLSLDLLIVTAACFAIVIYDLGTLERPLTLGLAGVFLLWGLIWIAQSLWVQRSFSILLRLPHWTVWFLCAGLLVWGS